MISNVSTGLFKDQGVESAIVAADLIGLLQQQSMEVVKDGQSSAQPTPQSASVADLSEHGPQFKKKDVVDGENIFRLQSWMIMEQVLLIRNR